MCLGIGSRILKPQRLCRLHAANGIVQRRVGIERFVHVAQLHQQHQPLLVVGRLAEIPFHLSELRPVVGDVLWRVADGLVYLLIHLRQIHIDVLR